MKLERDLIQKGLQVSSGTGLKWCEHWRQEKAAMGVKEHHVGLRGWLGRS